MLWERILRTCAHWVVIIAFDITVKLYNWIEKGNLEIMGNSGETQHYKLYKYKKLFQMV